jgi:hypothetical protein
MQTCKRTKNDADGVHGVANERDMEARAMGQQMQVLRIWLHWFQLRLFMNKCKQLHRGFGYIGSN